VAADTSRADRFADALTRLEQSRDASAMTDQFDEIGTEFTHVAEADDLAVLEWTSKGRLAAGRSIEYRGVSLLGFDGDRVRRFSTYYDTAAFVVPDAS
jgi:ketosteroid isomerase-like protein